jgi:hypothetical protein
MPHAVTVIGDAMRPMLNLEPLIARLVEDILHAIGDATLAELEAVTEREAAATVRTAPVRARQLARARGARLSNADSTTPEPLGADDITNPEQLLTPMPPPDVTEKTLAPSKAVERKQHSEPEEEGAPTPVQQVSHHRTPLRAGETVARASAAGVVIRRPKRA